MLISYPVLADISSVNGKVENINFQEQLCRVCQEDTPAQPLLSAAPSTGCSWGKWPFPGVPVLQAVVWECCQPEIVATSLHLVRLFILKFAFVPCQLISMWDLKHVYIFFTLSLSSPSKSVPEHKSRPTCQVLGMLL